MSPIDRARREYAKRWPAEGFDERVMLHARIGYVFATPDFFVMGRPVVSTASAQFIVQPNFTFPTALCDCTHIDWYSGDMRKGWAVMPLDLPLFSFERFRNGALELSIHKTSTIHRFTSR